MDMNICLNCMNVCNKEDTTCKHCGTNLGTRPATDNDALKIGTVLHGRYVVGKKLGQGGFGITYIGYDLVLSCKVAIKEYYPRNDVYRDHNQSSVLIWKNENEYQTGCKNILREAQKIAKVNDIPNVVRVQDTFEENRTAYIIMNYIEGTTLKEKIKKEGTLSFEKSIELLKPVITGLQNLHDCGIIHRDISPDNIMITAKNEPYLLDMGAAKDITSGLSEAIGVAKNGFSPLEQYDANTPIGPWVDVYALSATIFYCMSGKALTNSISRSTDQTIDFSQIKEKISKSEQELLSKGLETDYTKRLQNLLPFINYGTSADKPKGNRKASIIAGIAAALVVVIGLLSFGLRTLLDEKAEYLGNTVANINNLGGHVIDPTTLNYFYIDSDLNLYCNRTTDNNTLDLDAREKIAEQTAFLNVSESGLVYYLTYNNESEQYEVCSYQAKKKKTETLFSSDAGLSHILYVRTNKDNEYLYFLKEENTEADTDDFIFSFYRYDIQKGNTKLILDKTDISSFIIQDDRIYITENVSELQNVSYTTNLKGTNKKNLPKNSNAIIIGVTSDKLLMARKEGAVRVFLTDHNGKEITDSVFSKSITSGDKTATLTEILMEEDSRYVHDDNYIYFFSNGFVQQASFDGKEIKTVLSNVKSVDNMNIVNSNLYMQVEAKVGYVSNYFVPVFPKYENENYDCLNICFLDKNGDWYYIIQKDDLEYEIVDDSYVKITEYNPSEDNTIIRLTLPPDIDGYRVKEIGDYVFDYSEIKAFYCPYYLEVLGESAFFKSDLEEIHFNENLLKIGDDCFKETNIKNVNLPASLQSVNGSAFEETESLTRIYISDDNTNFTDVDGILFSADKTTLVAFPAHYGLTSYTVPDSVTTIGRSAFCCSELETVTLPESVESIREKAFFIADIKNLKLPESIKAVENFGITIDKAYLTANKTGFSNAEEGDLYSVKFTFSSSSSNADIVCYYESSVCDVEWEDNTDGCTLNVRITRELEEMTHIVVILMDEYRNVIGSETLYFI